MARTPTAPATALSEGGLGPYLRSIRAHKLVVLVVALIAVASAVAYLQVRPPAYEATARVLVNPIPSEERSVTGVQLLRDTPGDPTRPVQTAATLLESQQAAELAAKRLGPGWTVARVLSSTAVEPEGQSNVLAVVATGETGREAARIANGYVQAALDARRQLLEQQATEALSRLRRRQAALPPGSTDLADTLAEQIGQLQAIPGQGDPALSSLQEATVPTSPAGASTPALLMLALLAGLCLGAGAAILMELLDRTIPDEVEAAILWPLPVLARVPVLSRRRMGAGGKDAIWFMPPSIREAFRTLLAQLEQIGRDYRTLMITSASTGDGKTTSAVNLAVAIAASGHSVVLLDLDMRKPDVATKMGIDGERRLPEVLTEGTGLGDLLTEVPQMPTMWVFSPRTAAGDAALVDMLQLRVPELIAEARSRADYVIVDTAPLGEVSDALRVANVVDQIIAVIRPGTTKRVNFELMRDLLERTDRTPMGLLVIGQLPGMDSSDHAYGAGRRGLSSPQAAR